MHKASMHGNMPLVLARRPSSSTSSSSSKLRSVVLNHDDDDAECCCAGQPAGWARVMASTTTPTNGCRQAPFEGLHEQQQQQHWHSLQWITV
jgi:hypothetical protein